MTITFGCPHCGNLCAFDAQHAGRRARCTTCQKRFIVPHKPGEKVKKARDEAVELEEGPFSGFYRAVLRQSWKPLFGRSAAAPFVFLAIVVALKFFLGHPANRIYFFIMPVFVGWGVSILAWSTLFWYYTKVIYATAFGEERLPVIKTGLLPAFVWKVLVAAYSIAVTFVVAEAPFLIVVGVLKATDKGSAGLYLLLVGTGLFAVPMAVMILSVGRDIFTVLRIDQIARAIVKAFAPYLVVLAFFLAAVAIQCFVVQYARKAEWYKWQSWVWYLCNVLAVYFGIVVGRVAGFFYRHYGCYMPC
jgi:hypothetical protein